MIDRIASHAANDHSKQSVVPRKYPILYGMNQGFNVGFVSFFDSLVPFYSRDACYATAECDVL